MSSNRVLDNGRKTIAVFSGSMSSTYHEGIARGVSNIAEEEGYNVVIFSGGPLNSPDPLALSRETLFNLLDTELFDGVIIPVGSHTRFLSLTERDEFLSRYNSLPIINIGTELQGYTNIIFDYEKGIKEILKHYIEVHNYKRIAYIRGPKNHRGSDLREGYYRDTLMSYRIEYDKSLVFYSDLNRNAVVNIVDQLFDSSGKLVCDAIITNNDNQALGIMDALQAKGIRVPEDVAITGSINSLEGQFSDPPLNSIYEPTFEIGRAAALTLIDKINGVNTPPIVKIPTKLILRDSCGCNMTDVTTPHKYLTDPENRSSDLEMLLQELHESCSIIMQENHYSNGKLKELITSFKKAIETQKYTDFFTILKTQLRSCNRNEEIMVWLSILSEFNYCSCKYLELNPHAIAILECITSLISIKENIEQRAILFQSYETDYYISHFREIANNLNSSFDLNSVRHYAMNILDLTDLYISVYNYKQDEIESINNVIAVKDSELIDISQKHRIHEPKALLPQTLDQYNDRYTMIIFPLSFRKKPLGYIMHNLSNRRGSAYENMQAIISTALKNEEQIIELKKAEKRFSDIAHSTSNWLWETDENLRFIYSSYSVFDVLGYTNSEILEKELSSLSLEGSNNHLERMFNHDKVKNIEVWFKHKNESIKCLLMSAKPIFTHDQFAGYRGVFKDITEQKLQEEKINNLAYTDVLTNLPNRAKFQEELERIIKKAKENESMFALMFIDLDRFKYVNDTLGHDAGDLLLKEVSKRLLNATRVNDIVARLGGDEFTIILPIIKSANQVNLIAKRVLKKLEKPIQINNQPIHVTLSLGVSIYPTDGEDSTSLLKKSDNAMYQAKSNGRNRYSFYDKDLEHKNMKRYRMERILHSAIDNRELVLHYQPQIDIKTGEVSGVEALVRIENRDEGLITPSDFIPLAEELGLIGQIDLRVLEEACRQHIEWKNYGFGEIRISLNLSAVQLRNEEIVNTYLKVIKRYGVEPKYFKFELTEYTIIENEEIAYSILNQLKDIGFSIAIDDFGTGFSSMSLLNKYPIDTVKIDRSFIIDAVTNKKNRAIIQAIISLTHNLGMNSIAEGVETQEQYELIKSLGCSEIQGYYFHKPLCCMDLEELLSSL